MGHKIERNRHFNGSLYEFLMKMKIKVKVVKIVSINRDRKIIGFLFIVKRGRMESNHRTRLNMEFKLLVES